MKEAQDQVDKVAVASLNTRPNRVPKNGASPGGGLGQNPVTSGNDSRKDAKATKAKGGGKGKQRGKGAGKQR